MKKNTAIWLGIGGLILVAGGLYYALRRKSKTTELDEVVGDDKDLKTDELIKANPLKKLPKLSELIKLPKDTGTTIGSGVVGLAKSLGDFSLYEVSAKSANVRSEPNTKSKILNTFTEGSKFLGKEFGNNTWLMVAPGGQFISKNLVKKSTSDAKGFAGIK